MMNTTDDVELDTIHRGDAFDVLGEMPENSVHAIVSDPPYGLAFMGRDWDSFDPKEYQEWSEEWAEEAKRVLKPGGHLLAFSGNRTHHRMFVGVEDADFTVRDTLTFHYGGGFPKGRDVGKSVDKHLGEGESREVIGYDERSKGIKPGKHNWSSNSADYEAGHEITAPATDEAEQWDGWNSQLKPATEFIVLARNGLSESTITENVLEHGTGALNVDGCRIETDDNTERTVKEGGQEYSLSGDESNFSYAEDKVTGGHDSGRYPSNLLLDEQAAEMLDEQTGELSSGELTSEMANNADSVAGENTYGDDVTRGDFNRYGPDSGGASRFFYTSKASKAERTLDGRIDNAHPTVKPADLMEWLVKLVTREGQTVLDPFCGTGTTCKAAKDLGRRFIGIEQNEKWADVARVRCGLTPDDPSHVREDDAQQGLEVFSGGEADD